MISNGLATFVQGLAHAGAPATARRHNSDLMDEAVFQQLYQRTAPGLRSYIRMICGDAALTDDLLQESYYRFLVAGPPDVTDFQIKAYLYKTAISLVADHWRKIKRDRRWREQSTIVSETTPNVDLSQDMARLFQSLKPQQQTLLWLAYVEGFDHREIAALMGKKEKSIRVILLRARNSLRNILQKAGFGPKAL